MIESPTIILDAGTHKYWGALLLRVACDMTWDAAESSADALWDQYHPEPTSEEAGKLGEMQGKLYDELNDIPLYFTVDRFLSELAVSIGVRLHMPHFAVEQLRLALRPNIERDTLNFWSISRVEDFPTKEQVLSDCKGRIGAFREMRIPTTISGTKSNAIWQSVLPAATELWPGILAEHLAELDRALEATEAIK